MQLKKKNMQLKKKKNNFSRAASNINNQAFTLNNSKLFFKNNFCILRKPVTVWMLKALHKQELYSTNQRSLNIQQSTEKRGIVDLVKTTGLVSYNTVEYNCLPAVNPHKKF